MFFSDSLFPLVTSLSLSLSTNHVDGICRTAAIEIVILQLENTINVALQFCQPSGRELRRLCADHLLQKELNLQEKSGSLSSTLSFVSFSVFLSLLFFSFFLSSSFRWIRGVSDYQVAVVFVHVRSKCIANERLEGHKRERGVFLSVATP
jgi:hypothetical protein